MPGHGEQTLAFYAEHAATYVASGHGGSSRHLPEFLALLPRGSRILELGCGAGRDTRAMLDAGHLVDPTDGSPAIAERAAAFLQLPVRVMRFDELGADSEYDAVWANASLLHVPRDGLPAILAKVRKALRPGGLHHATYRAGDGEGRDSHGRFFNHLSQPEVSDMYQRSGGWDGLTVNEYVGGSFDPGVHVRWIAVLAKRAG